MRTLIEIGIIILLVYAGWNQPFRDHAAGMFPNSGLAPSRTAIAKSRAESAAAAEGEPAAGEAARQGKRDSSWMWKEGVMDRPYKAGENPNAR